MCLHKLFRRVRANFWLLPCDTSQEPNGNCSERLVKMNVFIWDFFGGGFSSCYYWEACCATWCRTHIVPQFSRCRRGVALPPPPPKNLLHLSCHPTFTMSTWTSRGVPHRFENGSHYTGLSRLQSRISPSHCSSITQHFILGLCSGLSEQVRRTIQPWGIHLEFSRQALKRRHCQGDEQTRAPLGLSGERRV